MPSLHSSWLFCSAKVGTCAEEVGKWKNLSHHTLVNKIFPRKQVSLSSKNSGSHADVCICIDPAGVTTCNDKHKGPDVCEDMSLISVSEYSSIGSSFSALSYSLAVSQY